tara:strand:+ start:161 stop:634 length:474 start_codon:yes stop_codon:yes gene_type:complete
MAKYITPTLTITSNKYSATTNPGPTSSPLNISVTDLLDVTQVDQKIVTVATADAKLFENSDYSASIAAGTDGGFVFLRNLTDGSGFTATSNIMISCGTTGDGELEDGGAAEAFRLMTLQPGEFAFFPWDMEQDIHVDASVANDDALEAILFVRTGTA